MSDLSITAGSVVKSTNANVTYGTAGETITAGQSLYLKESDGRYWKAQSDGTSAEAAFAGIALNGASAGQVLAVQTSGVITIGATVTVGIIYCVAATAGGICPSADLTSSDYVSIIGVGTTSALLAMSPVISGVEKP